MATKTPAQLKKQAAEQLEKDNRDLATKWLKEINRRRNKESNWRKQSRKVIDRYRDDRGETVEGLAKYNILWANVEVLKPAIFNHMPVPDVRRRYLTKDPAARTAALILERALTYCIDSDSYNFRDILDRSLEDYLLPGRGQLLLCYKPYFEQKRLPVDPLPDDGTDPDEDKEPKYPDGTLTDATGPYRMQEDKLFEEVYPDYVEWDLFVFGDCKAWSKVPWTAVGEYLTKLQVKTQFPDFKNYEDLKYSASKTQDDDEPPPEKALIWRVYHQASRRYLVFCDGYKEAPLLVEDDPLTLQNFYPMPEPLYAIRNNKDWTPRPEFYMYQDQANELDRITNRLKNLIEACKNRGVYDQAMDQLAKISTLMKAPDNEFRPIPNFAQLAEKGGLEALISSLPLEQIVATLQQLRERKVELTQEIYEIMGISDIVRGSSNANETLGAQQLKAQYAGMRISTRQERFQRFIRDTLRIMAEIIAEHFDPKTLLVMTGMQVIPDDAFAQLKQNDELPAGAVSESEFGQAIQIIKSDKLRGFKIDIETDSTIPVDRQGEQENRVAFMQAIGQYLQGVIPAVQMGAIPIKVAREALLFVVRGFKVGSELEEVLEELGEEGDSAQQMAQLKQTVEQLQQQLQDQGQQAQEAIGKLTQENQQLQSKAGTEQAKAAAKAETDQFSAKVRAEIDQAAAAQAMAIKEREAAQDRRLQEMQARLDAVLDLQKAEHDQRLADRESARQDLEAQRATKNAEAEQPPKENAALNAILAGQDKLSQAITALAEHSMRPVKRQATATLADGRKIVMDAVDTRQ